MFNIRIGLPGLLDAVDDPVNFQGIDPAYRALFEKLLTMSPPALYSRPCSAMERILAEMTL